MRSLDAWRLSAGVEAVFSGEWLRSESVMVKHFVDERFSFYVAHEPGAVGSVLTIAQVREANF